MHGVESFADAPLGTFAQRNIWWSMLMTELLMQHQSLRDAIPDSATIVVLPADDAELCDHNQAMYAGMQADGAAVLVNVRIVGRNQVVVRPLQALGPERVYAYG